MAIPEPDRNTDALEGAVPCPPKPPGGKPQKANPQQPGKIRALVGKGEIPNFGVAVNLLGFFCDLFIYLFIIA